MLRLRYSLASSFVAILVVALSLAALRSGSQAWHRWTYSLTFLILVTAAIASRSRSRRGSFWFGFAIFGWAYFVVGLGPQYPNIIPSFSYVPDQTYSHPNPNLMTTHLADLFVARIIGVEDRSLLYHGHFHLGQESANWIRRMCIIHLLLCPMLGILGGLMGLSFTRHDGDPKK